MLNQQFTKSEIHQLALGLFQDIPFQTEIGKEKMKAALHLYRSGNVYNIERHQDELRATMLADKTKVHIFLNIKTGFYGVKQTETEAKTISYGDEVYVTAALLGLFASVDSVGAFLDLWKTSYSTPQVTMLNQNSSAMNDAFFIAWHNKFIIRLTEQLHAKKYDTKEQLFLTYNQFLIQETERIRKDGQTYGLIFSYIPLYLFYDFITYQTKQNEYTFHPMRDTFIRRILRLAEKELTKLPKEVYIDVSSIKKTLDTYIKLCQQIISEVGLIPIVEIYGSFYTLYLPDTWHHEQIQWWSATQNETTGYLQAQTFHLIWMNPPQKGEEINWQISSEQANHEIYIFQILLQKTIEKYRYGQKWVDLNNLLHVVQPAIYTLQDERLTETLLEAYQVLAKEKEWRQKCLPDLGQFLPKSLPILADICWETGAYQKWIALLLLSEREDIRTYEQKLQKLYESDQLLLLPLFHRLAKSFIEEKNKRSYQTALFYIKKIKRLYIKNKKDTDWQFYYEALRENYKNLRSFQTMLMQELGWQP